MGSLGITGPGHLGVCTASLSNESHLPGFHVRADLEATEVDARRHWSAHVVLNYFTSSSLRDEEPSAVAARVVDGHAHGPRPRVDEAQGHRRIEGVGPARQGGRGRRAGAGPPQGRLQRPQRDAQQRAQGLGPVAQESAHPLGHRQHPMPGRHPRQDLVDEPRRRLGHAPAVAARTQAARAVGEGHQVVGPAGAAAHAGEAVGQVIPV